MARSLRFYSNRISFRVVSGQSSCLAQISSDSESFLVACASLSQDGFQCEGFWTVGRTHHLLPPPFGLPKFSRLVLGSSTEFFTGTSCCETIQASRYHCAWPRWEVLVNSSWTVAHQVPLSVGFFRQEYWSELPFSSLRNLHKQEIEPCIYFKMNN